MHSEADSVLQYLPGLCNEEGEREWSKTDSESGSGWKTHLDICVANQYDAIVNQNFIFIKHNANIERAAENLQPC